MENQNSHLINPELERFRDLANLLPQVVYEIDLNGNLNFVNEYAFEFFGHFSKDLSGINILDFLVPEDRKRAKQNIGNVIKGIQSEAKEYTILKSDGSTIPVLIYASPIIKSGEPVGLRGVLVDISYRKKIEDELINNVERINQIVENSREWIWEVDTKGLYTYCSRIVEDILGYRPSEILEKKHFYDLFHPDDKNVLKRQAFKVFNSKKPFRDFINRNIAKNGEIVWLSTSGLPILDDLGNLIGYRGADKDITERIVAEIERNEVWSKYQDLANSLPQIVYEIDLEGHLIYTNKQSYDIFGFTEEDFINGINVFDYLIPEDLERAFQNVKKRLKGITPGNNEYTAIKKDGTPFPVLIYSNPIIRDGNPIGLTGVIVDISERKAAEKELLQSKEQLSNILENTTNLFYAHTPDHQIIYVSPQSTYFLGCEPEEAMIRWTEFLSDNPINDEGVAKTVKAIETGKKQSPYELSLVKFDGSRIWVEVNEAPIVKNGKTEFMVGSLTDITYRKEAEDRLKQSEKRYKNLYDNALVGMFTVRLADGKAIIANKVAAHLFGYSSIKDFTDKFTSTEHYVNIEDREPIQKRLIKKGRIDNIVIHSKRVDGTLIWNEASFKLSEDKTLVDCMFVDVTNRISAELKLKKSIERFNHAVNATQDGLFDWDIIENKMYFSLPWKSMLGYSEDELPNDFSVWESLIHPDDLEKAWKVVKELIRGQRNRGELELRMKHKNGDWKNILSRAKVIIDENGKALRVVGTNFDLSDIRKAEKEAKKEGDRSKQYLDIAEVMLVSIDKQGLVQLINPKGCKVLGYKKEEILGKNWFDNFLPEKIRKDVKDVAKQVWNGELEMTRYHENEILTKYGEERMIAWKNSILRDEDENIIGTLSSGEDITEVRLAENKLQQSLEMLNETGHLAKIGGWEVNLENSEPFFTEEIFDIYEIPKDTPPSIEKGMEYYAPEARDLIQKAVQTATEKHEAYDLELPLISAKGNRKWVRAIGKAEVIDNKAKRLYGILHDITERKKAEDELIKYREQLEEMVQERTSELEKKNKELDEMLKTFVGRELKIRQLQEEVNSLRNK